MRIEGSVTSISWIPSEAVAGMTKGVFEVGFAHYDDAPPDDIGPDIPATLEALRAADRLRFANHLAAYAEFADGSVVDAGYLGGGQIGSTTVRLGKRFTVAAVSLPDRQLEPEIGDGWVRFTQSAGGRTGFPTPRAVRRPPFVQYFSPIAWSTLELTLHADGHSESRLVGASHVPSPLGLRRPRGADRQERPDRLQGLGRHGVRQAHAVGRRGVPGGGQRRRDGARASALGGDDARRRQARHPQAQGGRHADGAGRSQAASCSSCSTGCSSSRSTAARWPRSVRGPFSASGRSSRAAPGRRPCVPVRPVASPPSRSTPSIATSSSCSRPTIAARK